MSSFRLPYTGLFLPCLLGPKELYSTWAKLDQKIVLYFTHRNGRIFGSKTDLFDSQCDSFSSPEPTILLACGRNREALGASISGMRRRCRLRETGWAEFGYFHCYFKMVAPRALVFRPLVKGSEDLATRLLHVPTHLHVPCTKFV